MSEQAHRFFRLGGTEAFAPAVRPWLRFLERACVAGGNECLPAIVFASVADETLWACLDKLSGGMVVYPGPTRTLTAEAVAGLCDRRVARILCDILPDEFPVGFGASLWPLLRERFFFLPTTAERASPMPALKPGVLVVGDRTGRTADVLVCGVPGAILMAALRNVVTVTEVDHVPEPGDGSPPTVVVSFSDDPAQVAFCAAWAEAVGARLVDWRSVLSPLREPEIHPVRLSGTGMRAVLSELLGAVGGRGVHEPGGSMLWHPSEWLQELAADCAGGSAVPNATKRLTRLHSVCRGFGLDSLVDSDVREELVWRALIAGWYRGQEPLTESEVANVARRIRAAANGGEFSGWADVGDPPALARRLEEVVGWVPEVAAQAAICLVDGVCGRLLIGWRRAVAETALRLHLQHRDALPGWVRIRRTALFAAVGDLGAAEKEWGELDSVGSEGTAALWECLRYWMPTIQCGARESVGEDRCEWWWRHCGRPGDADCATSARQQLRWLGQIYLPSPGRGDAAATREDLQGVPTGAITGLVISAELCGRGRVMASVWEELRRETAPTDTEALFSWAVADALTGGTDRTAGWLTQVAEGNPGFFSRQWPPHHRCFLAALSWARIGDAERAEAWLTRALAEDPLARVRRVLLDRRPFS